MTSGRRWEPRWPYLMGLFAFVLIAHFSILASGNLIFKAPISASSPAFSSTPSPVFNRFETRRIPHTATLPTTQAGGDAAVSGNAAVPPKPRPAAPPRHTVASAESTQKMAILVADKAFLAINLAASRPEFHPTTDPRALPPAPAHSAGPVHLPDSRRLSYSVSGEARHFPYSAQAELLWQQDGRHYTARLEIAAMFVGSRIQTSAGEVISSGLAPTRFSDKLRSEVAAHFERDKGKISFSANTPDVPLEPGAQDRLSVLLQMAGLLAGDPTRYPVGSVLSMQTAGARDAEAWHFKVGGEEPLALPVGPHVARKLSREPQREHDLRVEVWLAADLAYLPVQLRMTQSNGDFVQLQLKSAENL